MVSDFQRSRPAVEAWLERLAEIIFTATRPAQGAGQHVQPPPWRMTPSTGQELTWTIRELAAALVDERDAADEKLAHLTELLHSAHAIAVRRGVGTAWERFAASIAETGIGPVTARTYRVLPDEADAPRSDDHTRRTT